MTATATTFDITIQREGFHAAKAAEWLEDYLQLFAETLGCQAADCEPVRNHIEALPWVESLTEAHMRIADWKLFKDVPGRTPSTDECDTYMAGWRTWYSATPEQRVSYVGFYFGVDTLTATNWAASGQPVERDELRCALYRHYDRDGNLLYVGISCDPDQRKSQHRRNSRWFRFVDSSDTEWFASTAEAHAAEREAIETERPLFNKTHNRKRHDAAIDYVLARMS